jgi:calcineurin-like phosphoesterase family protein
MNAFLIACHNEFVQPEDEVWNLGDFALGQIRLTLPIVGQLSGRQVLLAGNHDRCWAGARKNTGWDCRYLAAGFSRVMAGAPPCHPTMIIAGQVVLLSHFPYRNGGDSRDTERHPEYRLADSGGWLLHGHVHEKWRQKGRMINVGVDAWGGRPVAEDEIAALIEAGPRDLAPLPWPNSTRSPGAVHQRTSV